MHDLTSCSPFLEDKHRALAEKVSAFSREHLYPRAAPANDAEGRTQARELMALLGQQGFISYAHPLDLRACCLIREAVAAGSPLADEVFALQCLGSTPVASGGSSELVERWVKPAVSGELMAGFAMTEPEAGSDVASLRTRATAVDGGYELTGEKTFISNAGIADFYSVFASTDPDAGHRGISCFLVPGNAPGLELVAAQVLSAPHPLGHLRFNRCKVTEAQRIGPEGGGFKLGMATLDSLRTTVAAAACGMAARALEEAISHAQTRVQFGKPLAEQQLVQAKLARMATELTAARLLVYRAAHEKDTQGGRVSLPCAMAKLYATEAAQRIIDDAVQVLGGRGVLASSPVDLLYRAIRPLRIYEGTSEIQHLVIARQLLKNAGA